MDVLRTIHGIEIPLVGVVTVVAVIITVEIEVTVVAVIITVEIEVTVAADVGADAKIGKGWLLV